MQSVHHEWRAGPAGEFAGRIEQAIDGDLTEVAQLRRRQTARQCRYQVIDGDGEKG